MTRVSRVFTLALVFTLFALTVPRAVEAQTPAPPMPAMPPAQAADLSTFGHPVLIASALVLPDQAVSVAIGPQTVTIRPGTFDMPVAFDVFSADPGMWQPMVQGRTVKAAFAFRVRDLATGNRIGMFKMPVMYSYTGSNAAATDVILNTTAANPAAITVNMVPITFDNGRVNHPFTGAGVGWLVASGT